MTSLSKMTVVSYPVSFSVRVTWGFVLVIDLLDDARPVIIATARVHFVKDSLTTDQALVKSEWPRSAL